MANKINASHAVISNCFQTTLPNLVVAVAYRRQLIDWLKQIREHLGLFVLDPVYTIPVSNSAC